MAFVGAGLLLLGLIAFTGGALATVLVLVAVGVIFTFTGALRYARSLDG